MTESPKTPGHYRYLIWVLVPRGFKVPHCVLGSEPATHLSSMNVIWEQITHALICMGMHINFPLTLMLSFRQMHTHLWVVLLLIGKMLAYQLLQREDEPNNVCLYSWENCDRCQDDCLIAWATLPCCPSAHMPLTCLPTVFSISFAESPRVSWPVNI